MSRRSIARGVLAASLLALAAPTGAGAAALPADTTAVISGTPDLLGLLATPVASSTSTGHALSADGTKAVFSSASDGLVADDDDAVRNVYVKDVATGTVELASRADGPGGQPAHGDCADAVISADGKVVAFVCDGPLDPEDTNGLTDVYVRELSAGRTRLVSRGTQLGPVGDEASAEPAIDGTGRFVAFTSSASNLFLAPGSHTQKILRRELGNGDEVVLVSRAADANGTANVEPAEHPAISDNGKLVAFDTTDALDAAVDTNDDADVYLRDIDGLSTTLVSRADGLAGAIREGDSTDPVLSGGGLVVAFATHASGLDPAHADADEVQDVYARVPTTGRTRLISVTAGGTKGNGDSIPTGIDGIGDVVAFNSLSTNLDPASGVPLLPSAYVWEVGAVGLVAPGVTGTTEGNAALNEAGTAVTTTAFDFVRGQARVVLRNRGNGATQTISRPPDGVGFANSGGSARGGSVSADGRYVAFDADAPGLGAPASGARAIFVRDVVTGAVTLVSRADGPGGAPLDGFLADPRISADGRRVAFAFGDANGFSQVYVRDLASGRTLLVSRADGAAGAAGDGNSTAPRISDDGRRVAFLTAAGNLGDGDADAQVDVHVRDVDGGRTFLADRADGAGGAKADQPVDEAALSGDGRRVAFSTQASLDDADGNTLEDVYLRDIDGASTRLASVNDNGDKGNADSTSPSISRDGNRIAFLSAATNLGGTLGRQLYVRDVAAGKLLVASPPHGPAPVNDKLAQPLLSADGGHVAFLAHWTSSLAPGAPADIVDRAYERDLASGATRLISRRSGADGAPSAAGITLGGITADGGCVTFSAVALLPPPATSDYENVYMRTVTPDCGRVTGPGPVAKAAVLSGLKVKPARFHVGGRRGGTKVLFRLDRASGVTLKFERLLAGHRKKGKRCSTRVRRGKRCTVVRSAGRLSLAQSRLRAGANSVKFSGKLGRKALVPGRYRLTATPAGGKGRSVTVRVVKAPKRKHTSTKRKGH
jgi:Tol biopolymer transport system component